MLFNKKAYYLLNAITDYYGLVTAEAGLSKHSKEVRHNFYFENIKISEKKYVVVTSDM